MANDPSFGVRCPWCGPIALSPPELRCAEASDSSRKAICEFRCPACGHLVLVGTTGDVVGVVLRHGGGSIDGAAPFELLETHDGPALSWDDLLDLHLALDGTTCPQEELAVSRTSSRRGGRRPLLRRRRGLAA